MQKLKNFFSHPWKTAAILICLVAVLTIAGIGGTYAAGKLAERGGVPAAKITQEQAKTIALADAGLNADQVTFTKTKLELEDGIFVYEIDFFTDQAEYEYEIREDSGKIHKKSKQARVLPTGGKPAVSMEQAKAAALQDAGVSAEEAEFRKAELDDGIYELEFAVAREGREIRYDYEISADTGEILKKEIENPLAQKPEDTRISMEQAKAAALQDAGVSAQEATFYQEKTDIENGVPVIELEFYSTTHRYEYELNAETGQILQRKMELRSQTVPVEGTSYIGAERAKEIALRHAGLSAADVTFLKTELEHEQAGMVYELEFRSGRTEYEYQIHALTGEILEAETELE